VEVNPAAQDSLRAYEAPAVRRPEHAEGSLTRLMEQQTAKIPSHYFLFGAIAAMTASVAFEAVGNERLSRFTGLWAPTLMIAGVYNKLVKEFGVR
jgi:hypothetical protein